LCLSLRHEYKNINSLNYRLHFPYTHRVLCILLFLLLSSMASYAQKADTTDIINFDQAQYGVVLEGGKKSLFYGKVEFSQKGVYFYADTVYKTDNTVRAKGNVLIQQGDTLTIFGDSLYYNGDTKQCEVYSRVAFLKGDQRLYTEKLSYNIRSKIARYDKGGVVTNGKTWVKSTSCEYNTSSEDALLSGNVYVNDPDFNIKALKLRYNLRTRLVNFLSPTIITQSNGTKMYCESGYYDIDARKGVFTGSPQYQAGDARAMARKMEYDGLNGYYGLFGDARYVDSLRYVRGEQIKYYENIDFYDISGNAYFQDAETTLNGARIKFDKRNNSVVTEGRSRLVSKDNILSAEFNQFNNETGKGISRGNVVWHSIKDKSTIWAEEALTDRKAGSLVAYGKRAMVSLVDAADTIYLSADTLKSFVLKKSDLFNSADSSNVMDTDSTTLKNSDRKTPVAPKKNVKDVVKKKPTTNSKGNKPEVKKPKETKGMDPKEPAGTQPISVDDFVIKGDTSPVTKPEPFPEIAQDTISISESTDSTRIIQAYHKVKIFSNKFQGAGDSLYYSSLDSTLRLFNRPILWSDTINQYKADTIYVYMKNRQLSELHLKDKASVLTTPEQVYFNQIAGADIHAYMNDSQLAQMTVNGTARTVFYTQNDKKEYTGVNTMDCAHLTAWFMDNKLDRIRFYRQNDGKYYPMNKVNHADIQLKGFSWEVARRPTSLQQMRDEGANVLAVELTDKLDTSVKPAVLKAVKQQPKKIKKTTGTRKKSRK